MVDCEKSAAGRRQNTAAARARSFLSLGKSGAGSGASPRRALFTALVSGLSLEHPLCLQSIFTFAGHVRAPSRKVNAFRRVTSCGARASANTGSPDWSYFISSD